MLIRGLSSKDAPGLLGFRRKVATAPSFLVAKPAVPVAKCDYAPGFFEPCTIVAEQPNFDAQEAQYTTKTTTPVATEGDEENKQNSEFSLVYFLALFLSRFKCAFFQRSLRQRRDALKSLLLVVLATVMLLRQSCASQTTKGACMLQRSGACATCA